MKNWINIILIWLISLPIFAQAPLGFNYQGIARQSDGTPISGQDIGIKVSIIDGPQGAIQFTEEHFLTTNDFGLFTAIVGQGSGGNTLNSVDWAMGNLWLQIELDPDNSGNYIMMGSQQLMSVPYAMFAQKSGEGLSPGYGIDINNGTISNILPDRPISIAGVGNVQISGTYPNFTIESNGTNDADADPTNEIQTISKAGNEVTLSNAGGGFTDEVDDADADATNEIQDLQLVGNILTVTKNGLATTIDLSPYLDNTDTQLTEVEVDEFVNNNGYLTSELDGDASNELQTISKSGSTVTLSNGGGSFTDVVDDADADATNEIQNLANVLNEGASAGNQNITSLANPVGAQDAATKNYVDNQETGLQGSIDTEVTNRTNADGTIQAELDATQTGSGLDTDGGYTADATTNYLTAATDLKDADSKLDAQIETNSLDIGILTTAVKTFAFKIQISVTTAVDLSFDLSGFTFAEDGIISGSNIVIIESGFYKIKIKGTSSLAAPSDMFISINGSNAQVNKDGFDYYNDEFLFKLITGDVVVLKIISGGFSETFNMEFFGYKI